MKNWFTIENIITVLKLLYNYSGTIKYYIVAFIIFCSVVFYSYYLNKYYKSKIEKIELEALLYKEKINKEFKDKELSVLEEKQKIILDNEKLLNKLKEKEDELYKQNIDKNNKSKNIGNNVINNSRLFTSNQKRQSNDINKNISNTPTTMVNGETSREEFYREITRNITELMIEADKYKNQLESLQEWVKENHLITESYGEF